MRPSKNFTSKWTRRLPLVGIAALVAQCAQAQFLYDLSQPSPAPLGSAIINGGYLFAITPTTASGTGVFNTFLAMQGPSNGGTESGFNSSLGTLMPTVDDSKTSDILLSSMSLTTINSIAYYTFGLDINEPQGSGNEFLSMEQLQVWVRSSPLTSAATLADLTGSGATKVYDMDTGVKGPSTVLLNSSISSSGSGQADLSFLLPKSAVDAVAGINGTWNVYLFSQFGLTGTINGKDYQGHSGFEEWQQVSGLTYTPPPPIPEAGTVSAGVALAGASFGLLAWRRRRSAAAKA